MRGSKHVLTKGATPLLSLAAARKLLESVDIDTLAGLRDRALLSAMLYSFARVSAEPKAALFHTVPAQPRLTARALKRPGALAMI